MNTASKGGPDSRKPAPLSPDDERLKAFQPGPLSEKTKAEIAEHRAKYLARRQQRAGDPAPNDAPGTIRDPETGAVIIRPLTEGLRFSDVDQCSGMMPLEDRRKS